MTRDEFVKLAWDTMPSALHVTGAQPVDVWLGNLHDKMMGDLVFPEVKP